MSTLLAIAGLAIGFFIGRHHYKRDLVFELESVAKGLSDGLKSGHTVLIVEDDLLYTAKKVEDE